MKKIKKLIIIIMIVVIALVGNTYATSIMNSSQNEFKVRFSGKPIVSNESKVTATITNDINATVNVKELTMKENVETVTYIVQNTSKDLSANLSINIFNNNEEYFEVETKAEKSLLSKGEATKIILEIKLIKEPIDKREKAVIGVQLEAKPIQPEEIKEDSKQEQNKTDIKNNLNSTNNNYGYYEKDKTPKTGKIKLIDIFGR